MGSGKSARPWPVASEEDGDEFPVRVKIHASAMEAPSARRMGFASPWHGADPHFSWGPDTLSPWPPAPDHTGRLKRAGLARDVYGGDIRAASARFLLHDSQPFALPTTGPLYAGLS